MSTTYSFEVEVESSVVELFVGEESVLSEELPPEAWSSLILQQKLDEDVKRRLYDEGLFDPGSGEICTKYIAQSDSAILRHPYYNYPAVIDPGIKEALLDSPEKPQYPDDGQEKYLAVCSEMRIRTVDRFYRGLLLTEIDLDYYGVRSTWVRAMAIALKYNKSVKKFSLIDNFINNDACLHLGEMLMSNSALAELNLSGCRIGDIGLRLLLLGLNWNRALKILNLDKNMLTDQSGLSLAEVITEGTEVLNLSLRHNKISSETLHTLAVSFEVNNTFRNLDLSWNTVCTLPIKTNKFLVALSENNELTEVNLSWTGLSGEVVAEGIESLIQAPQLRVLNLSNNRLYDADITFAPILEKAQSLQTLNLSCNPLSPVIAYKLINKMPECEQLQQLLLENIVVSAKFMEKVDEIKISKPEAIIIHGRVITRFKPKGPDMRELLLNRIEALFTHTSHKKKRKKKPPTEHADIALLALQLLKDGVVTINVADFLKYVNNNGGQLDDDLVQGLTEAFPGSHNAKLALININLLVEFIRRKWPERHLPPTPPPEPVKPPKKKKGKGKKGEKAKEGARSQDKNKEKVNKLNNDYDTL